MKKAKYKQLDLFAGVGAFALAGERHKAESVMSVEIDNYASSVLRYNFQNMEVWNNDIRKLKPSYVSKHHGEIDIITSGFPCTSYSIAGKRKGFNDPRTGDLFDQTLRFVDALKPKIFIFENVKGLLNHDYGRTFAAMLIRMGELGCYEIEWQVLNSKDFGVPQNRERIFIVGHFGEESKKKIFPIKAKSIPPIKGESARCIDANYYKGIDNHGARTCIAVQNGHSKQNGKGWNDENFFCLDTTSGCGQGIGNQKAKSMIRKLKPKECERLQGFPDNWTKKGKDKKGNIIDISDTQQYKMMGNSISVPVLEEINKKL